MAADMVLRCCVFDGSMSLHEMDRRPYHRYCGCALHKLKGDLVSNYSCFKERSVSFPVKAKSGSTSLSISASKVIEFKGLRRAEFEEKEVRTELGR
ncbi:hypothetical protein PanWU01x14_105360 [Parasponia andersonii]|uniref:Uncharacterized protein n=1 Tax=Parasponia andersonii TaxID=3476 RepID=A0A2P5D1H1_PARAD|nr:hypothetical protein PanWU01x14_105360 [Parasponia andersonii]